MIPIKIGNWQVISDGIEFTGDNEYFIPKESLLERGSGERKNMYDFLVHLPTKSWLSVEDIYTLNTAYIYAINYFRLDLNKLSFVETMILQQKQLVGRS